MGNSKKKNDQIKVTITSMRLPVKLNDDELLARGRQLVENMRKTAAAEEAREVENKKRKSEIELLEEVTARLGGSISSGSEEREVECELRKDYVHGNVTTVRSDTGEVVDERTMTADERQECMPFAPAPRDPAKGKGGDPFEATDES
jgi:hypothetical protein